VSDAELVERARRGDTAAFDELVGRHRVAVYRAALAALGSPAEAEEAAQEALLTAYLKLHTFRGEAAFKTWLLSIAWREALDRRRSLRSRLRRLVHAPWEGDEDHPEAPAAGASPEVALLESEFLGQVRRLLGSMPARLRDPLLLCAGGERTYEEVATMLGQPVGTVKWRVMEARRRLRERLRRLGHADE
jgi:RNA polymerase sigma-70 factor (ECF subfamily)